VDASRPPKKRPYRKVATRPAPYRRLRPGTGEPIDDFEAGLAAFENDAAPVLRALPDLWPLSGKDRELLAGFMGIQILRAPAWMDWHQDFTRTHFAELRGTLGQLSAKEQSRLDKTEQVLLNRTSMFQRMIAFSKKATTVFGSMCWTLVEFRRPLLSSSDQPMVTWPLAYSAMPPQQIPVGIGLVETLEVRLPVTPYHAVLLTWSLDPSDEGCRVMGKSHHAGNINAFTIANADRDWFHVPGGSVPRATGYLRPISTELVRGYDASIAVGSSHRAQVEAVVKAMPIDDTTGDSVPVIKVAAPAP
jgi:hypothetical protein